MLTRKERHTIKDTRVATGNGRAKRENRSNEVKTEPEKKYL